MDNVLQFPAKKKDLYEILKTETEGEKFICFYFNPDGKISYSWGEDLTLQESAFLEKVLSIFIHDEFKREIDWGDA